MVIVSPSSTAAPVPTLRSSILRVGLSGRGEGVIVCRAKSSVVFFVDCLSLRIRNPIPTKTKIIITAASALSIGLAYYQNISRKTIGLPSGIRSGEQELTLVLLLFLLLLLDRKSTRL